MIDMMNGDLLELRAAQLRALGDPVRLGIVHILGQGTHCVCEIQAELGAIAPNLLSYHLGVLRAAGLASVQRRGRRMDYRLCEAEFRALGALLPGPLPGDRAAAAGCARPASASGTISTL